MLSDAQAGEVVAYAYATGDVVWLTLGDEASVAAVLEGLP